MLKNLKSSLKNFNYQLYFSLLVLGICPTIYTAVRVFLIGQLPDDWAFSIAGQLSWVNLIYEVVSETILLPLFYFIGNAKSKAESGNRIRTGLIISFLAYALLSLIITIFTKPLMLSMAVDKQIIEQSVIYIRIESVANVFSILSQFLIVALISVNKSNYLYTLTITRLILSVITDVFFISKLPFSLNLGVNGIGYSNILVNLVLFVISVYLLKREGITLFSKAKLKWNWMKEFSKVGGISGVESFIRNLAYMIMISRMVNVVGEQGTYWVANNFIWSWLLLPVLQLGELIKKETAQNKENIRKNSLGYFTITFFISLLWVLSIPLWKPFMRHILLYDDIDKLFSLVLILLGFYILYAFQNVFDSTFYGVGKTNYMLFESIVTNSLYYGTAFVLYLKGVFVPTLNGIALLFGFGMAFDSVVSLLAYIYYLKKHTNKER